MNTSHDPEGLVNNMLICQLVSQTGQTGDFVRRDRSAAKGPLTLAVVVEHSDHCVTPRRAKLQNTGPYLRIDRGASSFGFILAITAKPKEHQKKIQTQRLRCLVLLSTAEQNEPQKLQTQRLLWLVFSPTAEPGVQSFRFMVFSFQEQGVISLLSWIKQRAY